MPRVPLLAGVFVVLGIGFFFTFPCGAAEFPTKPVTLMVGFVPGGPSDIQARAIATGAEPFLGQPVVVANKSGASGTVMMTTLATSKPDGYTLCLTPGSVAVAPYFVKVSYDLTKDFTYLIALAVQNDSLTVRADSPWKTLKEAIEYARQNPDMVKIGTPGVGISVSIIAEMVGRQAGVKWTIVPFKGAGEVTPALLGGHIHIGTNTGEQFNLVKAGKLRLLAVATPERLKEFPDAPTLRELGFDLVTFTLCGILGPPGIPEPVAKKLTEAFAKAKDQPAYLEIVKSLNLTPLISTGKDFQRLLAEHYKRIGEFMKK